ncbi:Uncharacterised protein [Candidatus Tiddalikarchaeum anstoanum]|nr:Uncharacterised protein [Candidatus Tiddalikarchaeum anstoanum]
MKKAKKNNTTTIILIILLAIMLLSSVLSVFVQKETKPTMKLQVGYYINGQTYPAQEVKTDINNTLYGLLTSLGTVELTQEGNVKCFGQYCNNFLPPAVSWTIFVNNYPQTDLTRTLKENDYVTLYFGHTLNFGNVTLTLNIEGYNETNSVLIVDNTILGDMMDNYNGTFMNNTLNCLFELCNNENNTWTIMKNNEIVNNYNTTLRIGDALIFKYE